MLLLGAGLTAGLGAVDSFDLHFESLAGAGWTASDVRISLSGFAGAESQFLLTAARVELPDELPPIENVSVRCEAFVLRNEEIACEKATASLPSAMLDAPQLRGGFRYRPVTGEIDWRIDDLALAGGRVRVEGRHAGQDWRMSLRAADVDLARLTTVAGRLPAWPVGLTAQGHLTGTLAWSGRTDDPGRHLQLDAGIERLGYALADGASAAEDLNLRVKLAADRDADDWRLSADVQARDGTFCLEDCWSLLPTPLDVRGKLVLTPTRLAITGLRIVQDGVVRGEASAEFAGATRQLTMLGLRIDSADVATLYPAYLQPLLIGTALEALEMTGSLRGRIDYARGGDWHYDLTFEGVDAQDANGRFAVNGLRGHLLWGDPAPTPGTLAWEGGKLFRLPVGAGQVALTTTGHALALREPVELPVLDGVMRVERFTLADPATPHMQGSIEGLMTPVSMEAFSRAMDWPVMRGKLSGMIPEVRLAKGSLDIGGVLLVRAFDGTITVRDLRIEDLFGVVPRLYTDVTVDNIDLDALTSTFEFGNIQGRFSGQVDNLVLSRWQPVSFDAVLATPENDRSRHRISQKAVNNLTSIGGGGVSGALSRSFLGVFENFGYDRLGISCRLRNGVCQMDGVAPAGEGYYIVKGGGLPRIDVIGYSREVDWEVLLARLQRITDGSGAVVE